MEARVVLIDPNLTALFSMASAMIEITSDIKLREDELNFDFVRGSGPGGQKADHTASAVQLRFDIPASRSLPVEVKQRLQRLARNRVTKDGELIIEAKDHRSQARNREAAVERLVQLIRRAVKRPKRRKRTKPPKSADERRLREKKRRSRKKRQRRYDPERDGYI